MRVVRIAAAVLMFGLAGCSQFGQDFAESRPGGKLPYGDSDPQDFGATHPGLFEVHGIDLSKWNTGNIDWAEVKKAGIAFAFIKATEGTDRLDSSFMSHWRGAASAGIAHAPYHFYYFCAPPEPQAAAFIANVPKAALKMPPVLDVEWNPASPTCKIRPDPESVRNAMQRFLDLIEAHYGKRPIIYTSVDFHRDNLVGAFRSHPFWLRSVAAHPSAPYPGRPWIFWQYTGTGIVPGIPGKVDINVFNGNRRQWANWLSAGAD